MISEQARNQQTQGGIPSHDNVTEPNLGVDSAPEITSVVDDMGGAPAVVEDEVWLRI